MANLLLRSGLSFFPRGERELRFGKRRVMAYGLPRRPWTDIHHSAMVVSWTRFLLAFALIFLGLNTAFAALYWLGEAPIANAQKDSFSDLFFFSAETVSTTGYGDMHPQTLYAHAIATLEMFVSLVFTATMTGLVFARFSRPRARLVFAEHPVRVLHDGVDTLMIRLVNARHSFITEATAKIWMLSPTMSAEGQRFVSFLPLQLIRAENPSFALSWTLFHPVDEHSPLAGWSAERLIAERVSFIVNIAGRDETSTQEVRARYTYSADDIRFDHEYVDMLVRNQDGLTHIDFSKIHHTQPRHVKRQDAAKVA